MDKEDFIKYEEDRKEMIEYFERHRRLPEVGQYD